MVGYTYRQMNKNKDRSIDIQTDGQIQTDEQMDRHKDRWIDLQTDGQTFRQINRMADRQTD